MKQVTLSVNTVRNSLETILSVFLDWIEKCCCLYNYLCLTRTVKDTLCGPFNFYSYL